MFQLTLAVALASISVLGILFNSAILSSLMNKLQLQTIANIFFFNQALADVLFLSLLPLIGTEYYLNRWIFGEVACKSLVTLDSMNQFTSVFLLTVMSVDRYLSLSRPLSGVQFRTQQYAWILSGTAWLLAALVCCPLWFSSQSFQGDEDSVRHCYFLESEDSESAHYYKLFTVWAFAIGFCIPLIIISSTNYSILGHIRQGHTVTSDTQSRVHTNNRPSRDERRKKTCVIVVACTGIFAICWLPLYIFLIYVYFFAAAANPTPGIMATAFPENNSTNITIMSPVTSVMDSTANTSLDLSGIRSDVSLNGSIPGITPDGSMETMSASVEDETLNHIRMFCLILSYCNGMFNPIVLLIMSGNIRKNMCSCFSNKRPHATMDPTHLQHSKANMRNNLRKTSSHYHAIRAKQGGERSGTGGVIDDNQDRRKNERTLDSNGNKGHKISNESRKISGARDPELSCCHQENNNNNNNEMNVVKAECTC